MNKSKSIKQGQRRLNDLVGIDFSTTATKVVRLKYAKGELCLAGLTLLPAVDFGVSQGRLELPRNLTANYGCMAYTGASAVVRMVNTQLPNGEEISESSLRELLNVTADYRVTARVVSAGKGRQDSSLLAAAIPDADACSILNMFPGGAPAPASLEVSGLSFISAFLHARGEESADSTVCLLEAGESISHFAFLKKGEVALVGKMPFGAQLLRKKLADDLGVDDELAASILSDRSINITSSLTSVLDPFVKQISISKDFIERHLGCRVSKIYISGGLSLISSWSEEVGQMLRSEIVPWSPLENITCDPGIIPEELSDQVTRFSAAIGAAIGGFEDQ